MPFPAARPTVRIDDDRTDSGPRRDDRADLRRPRIAATATPAATPGSPRPTGARPSPAAAPSPAAPRAARGSRPPVGGARARAAKSSGRAHGGVRPPPPPGDDRPRTDNWPQDRVAAASTSTRSRAGRPPLAAASHRVVERGPQRDPVSVARMVGGVVAVIAVLAVVFVGYTKIRDAAPSDADTLAATAAPATKEPATALPLAKVVLALTDLPAGWASQSFNAAADDICLGRIPRSVLSPVELDSASFTKGASGPYITNVVSRFGNETQAKQFMQLTAETIDSCRSYVDNGSTIKLGPLSFPEFGDETFAAKATGTSPYGALDGDIIYVRQGNRVASIQTISFGSSGVSNELVAFLTRLLARRL